MDFYSTVRRFKVNLFTFSGNKGLYHTSPRGALQRLGQQAETLYQVQNCFTLNHSSILCISKDCMVERGDVFLLIIMLLSFNNLSNASVRIFFHLRFPL